MVAWPVAAIVISVVGWFLLLSALDEERAAVEGRALRQAEVLSISYGDQILRAVEAIDQIALQVRYHWELSGGELRLNDTKAQTLFPPTEIFYISITGENGMQVTGTLPTPTDVYIGDRQYFQVHKTAVEDFLYIGEPLRGRVSKRATIPFSRRIIKSDGSFGGVVAVSVAPQYFTANYNEATFGSNGFLGVVGSDSMVRVTRTGNDIFPSLMGPELVPIAFPIPANSVLLDGDKWFSDGRNRYVGWSPVRGYPVVAMVGLDQEGALAPYMAERAANIRNALLATAALAVFTLIAMAFSLRLAWGKSRLEAMQSTYRMATEGGNEGFYIARPVLSRNEETIVDFKIIDCNRRGAELFGHRREELVGKTICSLYRGNSAGRVMNMLREAMETGTYESEVNVPQESPFAANWAHVKIVRTEDSLAVTLRDISEAKAHVAQLERQSNEDPLTGLPNRHWVQSYLPKAIEQAAGNNTSLAILFIDLDGFKAVNDTMGHEAGDDVLRNASRRLKLAVRPHDCVARLGGDEFVVILEGLAQKADAAHVAERILQAFQERFRHPNGMHSIGASIGISMFPADGADADTLLRNADIAMYAVKTGGKRNYSFYDQKFYDLLRARLESENELRHAIEHDQFVMYYQPRVEIASGRTSSMEALVRWAHPTKGLIGPLEFIPLAEETGLIVALGKLVMDKVCSQLAYWSRTGQVLVPVSINVSPRQFNEADVPRLLSEMLARHRISPELVEIEVTESSMMGENPKVCDALSALQQMGIRLSVDDFGTGYSSLSQLQRMDFDMLKVDRAFTVEVDRTEQGNVLVTAIITMAHALGMRVVAEGVENERQIKVLESLNCDEIQGFYISAPLPPSETQPLVSKRHLPITA